MTFVEGNSFFLTLSGAVRSWSSATVPGGSPGYTESPQVGAAADQQPQAADTGARGPPDRLCLSHVWLQRGGYLPVRASN